MKIRDGFVSNSSSSSFIVVQDEDKSLILSMEIPKNLITLCKTKEDLLNGPYKYCDDDELKNDKEYQQCLNALKEGKVIKYFRGSNEDDSFLSALYGVRLDQSMVSDDVEIILDGSY